MANTKKPEEGVVTTKPEEGAVTTKPEEGTAVKTDPWKTMCTIYLPRAMAGQQKHVVVGVNGRRYQVPRGKSVEVPLPLYERLQLMLEAEERTMKYMETIPNEAAPGMEVKRLG